MVQAASLVYIALGAALVGVVTVTAVPPLAWIALTVLLHGTRSMRVAAGAGVSWLALFLSFALTRRGAMPMPAPAYYVVAALDAAAMTLPFVIDRAAVGRLDRMAWMSTLIFPLALTVAEFLRARLTPAGNWQALANSQYGVLSLMQLAALVGMSGITFLIAWTASTAEFVWRARVAWHDVRGPFLVCGSVVLATLVIGTLRIATAPAAPRTMRVATVNRPADLFAPGEMTRIAEGRIPDQERAAIDGKLARLHDWFLDSSRREARAGAKLIAWPEQNLLIWSRDEPAFLERAKRLATDERVYLAMGMGTIHVGEPHPFENKLLLIDPSGAILVSHVKTRPVPGWEAGIMRPGEGPLPVVSTPEGRIAAAICYEADLPGLIGRAGREHADIGVIVVNDWRAVKDSHFQMHAFRAIENGMAVVRPAASGVSAAFDPWGRVLGVADFFASGDRTMIAQVPVGGVRTLYARIGDLFAWSCLVALGIALVAAVVRQ
jgi:apolipoprotein N-acyltransferase